MVEPTKGFWLGYYANIVQELMPKAGVEQVEYGVLGAANIAVRRAPLALPLRIDGGV